MTSYIMWQRERDFADVIKVPNQFDLELIKREIILGGSDIIR